MRSRDHGATTALQPRPVLVGTSELTNIDTLLTNLPSHVTCGHRARPVDLSGGRCIRTAPALDEWRNRTRKKNWLSRRIGKGGPPAEPARSTRPEDPNAVSGASIPQLVGHGKTLRHDDDAHEARPVLAGKHEAITSGAQGVVKNLIRSRGLLVGREEVPRQEHARDHMPVRV